MYTGERDRPCTECGAEVGASCTDTHGAPCVEHFGRLQPGRMSARRFKEIRALASHASASSRLLDTTEDRLRCALWELVEEMDARILDMLRADVSERSRWDHSDPELTDEQIEAGGKWPPVDQ